MQDRVAAYLICFDEERRNYLLNGILDPLQGFSDALSSADWSVRQWEVCGLMFEPDVINHWALARKGNGVATGKVKVEFTEVMPTNIRMSDVVSRIGSGIQRNVISSRSGAGGSVPGGTWQSLKSALAEIDPAALETVARLERLRSQSRDRISRGGSDIVALQRDATGVALDVFDQSGALRKNTLRGWTAPSGNGLTSFLDGLNGVRTIEDQLLARDAASFPDVDERRTTVLGAVFSTRGRKLEVFNVNRSAIEGALGVDLLYFNEEFDAWTLVQYKSMGRPDGDSDRLAVYRPDANFDAELARMVQFRQATVDRWEPSGDKASFRLSGDGFFFKFCSKVQLEVLSEALLPGMYLAREHLQAVLADPRCLGPRRGRQITFENCGRHTSNSLFSDRVRDGWIGTRTLASTRIAEIAGERLAADRAVVVARARHPGRSGDLEQTMDLLQL